MSETNSLVPQQLTTDESRPADTATTKTLEASGHSLFERLGIGVMGEVYRCGDDALQRDLAIRRRSNACPKTNAPPGKRYGATWMNWRNRSR